MRFNSFNFIHFSQQNTASEKRSVEVCMHLETSYYTGVIAEKVKTQKFSFVLKPNEGEFYMQQ